MDVQSLDSEVKAKIRSGYCINNVVQCVNELVLNSLDAKANCIAVRVNLTTFRIQVVDDGEGITEENLTQVGKRYYTNKCHSLVDLERNQHFFGYKGEALASIAANSKIIKVVTRSWVDNKSEALNDKTLLKTIDGKSHAIEETSPRPSGGTTITIEQFLCNLPVRQKRTKHFDFNEIIRNLKALFILHPGVTISVRDDSTKQVLFTSTPVDSMEDAMLQQIDNLQKESIKYYSLTKGRTVIKIVICLKLFDNNKHQLFYVNKRPINSCRLTVFVNDILLKSSLTLGAEKGKKTPNFLYVCTISCPHTKYEIVNCDGSSEVEFKNWDSILKGLERLLTKILEKEKLAVPQKSPKNQPKTEHAINKQIRLSGFHGAHKASAVKRVNEVFNDENEILQVQIDDQPSIAKTCNLKIDGCPNKSKSFKNLHQSASDTSPSQSYHSSDINQDQDMEFIQNHRNYYKNNKRLDDREYDQIPNETPLRKQTRSQDQDWKYTMSRDHGNTRIPDEYPHRQRDYYQYHHETPKAKKKQDRVWEQNILGPSRRKCHETDFRPYHEHVQKNKFVNNVYEDKSPKQLEYLPGKDYVMHKYLSNNPGIPRKPPESFTREFRHTKRQEQLPVCLNRHYERARRRDLPETITRPRYPIDKGFYDHLDHDKRDIKNPNDYCTLICPNPPWDVSPFEDNFTFKMPYQQKPIMRKRHLNHVPHRSLVAPSGPAFTFVPPCYEEPITNQRTQQAINYKFDPINFTFCQDDIEELDSKSFVHPFKALRTQRPGFFKQTLEELDLPFAHEFERVPRSSRHQDPKDFPNQIAHSNSLISPHSRDYFEQMLISDLEFSPPSPKYECRRPRTSGVFFRTLASDVQSHIGNRTKTSISVSRKTTYTKYVVAQSHRNMRKRRNIRMVKRREMINKRRKVRKRKIDNRKTIRTRTTSESSKETEIKSEDNKVVASRKIADQAIQCTLAEHDIEKGLENDLTPEASNPVRVNIIENIVFKPGQLQYQENNNFTDQNIQKDVPNASDKDNERMDCSDNDEDIITATPTSKPSQVEWFSHNFANRLNVLKNGKENENCKDLERLENEFSPITNLLPETTLTKILTDDCDGHLETKRDPENQKNDENHNEVFFNLSIAIKELASTWTHNDEKNDPEPKPKNDFFNDNDSLADIFDSTFTQLKSTDNANVVQSEWSRKLDEQGGSYYINRRTGNTMHQKPMELSDIFELAKRPVDLPKGFSQISGKETHIVETVSSGTKREFHAAVCESYEDELGSIKWKKHYLQNTDPELFFKHVYEKHFIIDDIVNLKLPKLKKSPGLLNSVTFTKDMFRQLDVMGQNDHKFIVAVWKPKSLIVFFDQHAVHERIRLEQLYKSYRNEESGQFASKSLKPFDLPLNTNAINDCVKYSDVFQKFGIEWSSNLQSMLRISSVPACVFNKGMRESSKRNEKIAELTKALLFEILNCMSDAAVQRQWVPNLFTNLINSEACRGAIMFGDALEPEKSQELITDLSTCNLPFQCAHGRPTCVPIFELSNYPKETTKINLKILKPKSRLSLRKRKI